MATDKILVRDSFAALLKAIIAATGSSNFPPINGVKCFFCT